MELDSAQKLTTIEIYERIELDKNHITRIDSIEVQSSNDQSTWTPVEIGSISDYSVANLIRRWTLNDLQVDEAAKYYHVILKGYGGISVWEIEGYAYEGEPGRAALLSALEDAVLCKETDFSGDSWSTFLTAYEDAIAAANSANTDDATLLGKAQALNAAMNGITLTPELTGLSVTAPAVLPLNGTQQLTVDAIYDRGSSVDVTKSATFTSSNSEVVAVTNVGVVTGISVGKSTITVAYGGKSEQVEIEVLQNPNGVLTVVCGVGGTITRDPQAPYVPNQEVNLTAVPDDGYLFDHWLVDGTENTNQTITVKVGTEQRVEAVFVWDYVGEVEQLIDAIVTPIGLNSKASIDAANAVHFGSRKLSGLPSDMAMNTARSGMNSMGR